MQARVRVKGGATVKPSKVAESYLPFLDQYVWQPIHAMRCYRLHTTFTTQAPPPHHAATLMPTQLHIETTLLKCSQHQTRLSSPWSSCTSGRGRSSGISVCAKAWLCHGIYVTRMTADCMAEEIAEQRAVQVIGRELLRHCNEGELKFKQPLGIVTDMCQIDERLPG